MSDPTLLVISEETFFTGYFNKSLLLFPNSSITSPFPEDPLSDTVLFLRTKTPYSNPWTLTT